MRISEPILIPDLDRLPEPSSAILDFIGAWKASREDRLVPRKRDFDPLLVPHLLPNMWIYHDVGDEASFHCRLAGEKINDAWGAPISGRSSAEILGPDNAKVMSIWRAILDEPLVHYGSEERLSGNLLYRAERMVAPLADDDDNRAFILGISLYELGGDFSVPPPVQLENCFHIPCRNL